MSIFSTITANNSLSWSSLDTLFLTPGVSPPPEDPPSRFQVMRDHWLDKEGVRNVRHFFDDEFRAKALLLGPTRGYQDRVEMLPSVVLQTYPVQSTSSSIPRWAYTCQGDDMVWYRIQSSTRANPGDRVYLDGVIADYYTEEMMREARKNRERAMRTQYRDRVDVPVAFFRPYGSQLLTEDGKRMHLLLQQVSTSD